ncbi:MULTISPECIES: hypothetical protein [unclassified Deinococcus]|uniref:hypothetical protein n=1 Tax=unclassified Deinococcus TaxID=2623546 RepID=UPI001E5F05A5|nr:MULTISPECIES: hypothetical protein [unclassified Deinococcus]MCD0164789.1 hypothetical protein [Deinococcus sp. 12RED42]MCD0168889.1 hypothetical protein [Deinococcus sp. 23YEL01]MCD0174432.1 hypothetical protein [Deinococcus sp. 14RED07]
MSHKDKPVGNPNHHEAPLVKTKRRYLLALTVAATASLVSCGYGFVPPVNDASDSLIVNLTPQERAALDFFDRMQTQPDVQKAFAENPTETLIRAGVLQPQSQARIDQANRLLVYIMNNHQLQDELGLITTKYPNLQSQNNLLTGNNINIEEVKRIENEMLNPESEWSSILEEQTEIMMRDPIVREILGINIRQDQVKDYSQKLSKSLMSSASQKDSIKPQAIFIVVNANIYANVNWKVNANVNYNANANVNANWNANANANANVGTAGRMLSTGGATVTQWSEFADQLSRHVQQTDKEPHS